MSGRTKTLVGILIATAVLIAAAAYVATRLRPAIAGAIEQYGTLATGTEVNVGSVAVSLADSRATLSDVVVGNPEGYTTDYALRIGEVGVVIDVPSLARNTLVLHDVTLGEATLNAEQHGASSNLTEILDHMGGREGKSTVNESKKIIIDRFRLAGGRVAVTSEIFSTTVSLDLPEVVVDDLGKGQGGISFDEAADRLLEPILIAARDAVRERLRNAAEDTAQRKLRDAARKRLEELAEPEN